MHHRQLCKQYRPLVDEGDHGTVSGQVGPGLCGSPSGKQDYRIQKYFAIFHAVFCCNLCCQIIIWEVIGIEYFPHVRIRTWNANTYYIILHAILHPHVECKYYVILHAMLQPHVECQYYVILHAILHPHVESKYYVILHAILHPHVIQYNVIVHAILHPHVECQYYVIQHAMLHPHVECQDYVILHTILHPHVECRYYVILHAIYIHTLNGRTGSALVWHSEGRTIEADSVQQVL